MRMSVNPTMCVCLFICQSDSLSATNLINSRPSIHDILHKSFTFPTGIPFGSSFQVVGPHTGYYTVCYVICVTHWIHAGWSMSPRTSLESTKSIISLNCLSFDAAEFWCIISLKVINILFKPLLLANPSADVYTIYSYVHVYGFESHQLWISL